MSNRRTDRTLAEKKAVQARRAKSRAAKKAARVAALTTPKPLTDSQKLDRLRKSRRQSERTLARKTQRPRAARRTMQRAIAKAQRILQKE
jgi:hypothetical protein